MKVLVSSKKKLYNKGARDFNWVPEGNILGIASTGDAFVSLEGDRKCTMWATVEDRDVDLKELLRESTRKGFGGIMNDEDIEEAVEEEFQQIQDIIEEFEK